MLNVRQPHCCVLCPDDPRSQANFDVGNLSTLPIFSVYFATSAVPQLCPVSLSLSKDMVCRETQRADCIKKITEIPQMFHVGMRITHSAFIFNRLCLCLSYCHIIDTAISWQFQCQLTTACMNCYTDPATLQAAGNTPWFLKSAMLMHQV